MQEAKPCALQVGGRSQDSFHQVMLFRPFAPALHLREPQRQLLPAIGSVQIPKTRAAPLVTAPRPWGEQQSCFPGNNSTARQEKPKDP